MLYAGAERLDPQRRVLGEPPLVDGAVLALHGPVPDVLPDAEEGLGTPQLHVVAGPDAGGVHLLHPGAVRIGRSADADVPLDDPDVSRAHCAVTVMPDGRVAVADLNSTNGTTLDGVAVGERAVALAPGGPAPGRRIHPAADRRREHPAAGHPGPGGPPLDPPARPSAAGAPGDGRGGAYPDARRADGSAGGYAESRSGAQGLLPHPAPSRNGGSAPGPASGPGPGTPHPDAPVAGPRGGAHPAGPAADPMTQRGGAPGPARPARPDAAGPARPGASHFGAAPEPGANRFSAGSEPGAGRPGAAPESGADRFSAGPEAGAGRFGAGSEAGGGG
ncbi:hypothetical protein GCM10020254_52000 [Streptomyces goshikiensis]